MEPGTRRRVATVPVAGAAGKALERPGHNALTQRRSPAATGWPGGRTGGSSTAGSSCLPGTIVLGFDTDFTKPVFGWSYFHGNFYLGYKEVLNVLGTVLIAGVLVMMFRRGVLRPRKLDYTRPDRAPGETHMERERRVYRVGDWAFISILLVIALTGFVLEGVRIAMSNPGYGGTQFGGWVVAQAFSGVGNSTLGGIRHGLWWFHGLLAITFVASIPYTKAAHMITSYLSLSLRDPLAGKRLKVIPPERASEPAGYGKLDDFAPLHLLQLDACTKCGRCHAACPANATGRPLSPRDVVLELHEQSNAAIGGVLGGLLASRPDASASDDGVIGHDGVRTETVWSCMQCNACVEACPVGIEQAPIINQLRRRLVEEGELDPNLQSVLQTIHKSGNSFGERNRTAWPLDRGARLRSQGRPPRAGRDPLVRRRLRQLRPPLPAGLAHAGPAPSKRRRRLRDPLRRRAQLRQRRSPDRRGGAVREPRRTEHRDDLGVRVRADHDHRPAFAQHTPKRVPATRGRLAGRSTTPSFCSN